MNAAPLHDTRAVIRAEIHQHAGLIAHYATMAQMYAEVGDDEGMARAIRHCTLYLKASIGEYNALCEARRPSNQEVAA